MITHTLTRQWRGGSGAAVGDTIDVSADGEANKDIVVETGTTDQVTAFDLDITKCRSFFIRSNADVKVETNSGGVNEKQRVTITGTPTGGTFTLTFEGQTTAGIAYNANAAAVQSALEALSNVAVGEAVCTNGPLPGTAVDVEFKLTLGESDRTQMTADGSGLTGGSTPTVTITTTQPGVAPSNVLNLLAGRPYDWYDGDYAPFLITANIAAIYITNASGQQATVKIRTLSDN